jgi:heme-degrading monooxygenase HmoA
VFTTIWEYEVSEPQRAEFERTYGADGAWVQLFRRAPGFRETVLLRAVSSPGIYVTLDRWASRAAYEEFRIVHAAAYAALDEATTGLTLAERHLGTFYG